MEASSEISYRFLELSKYLSIVFYLSLSFVCLCCPRFVTALYIS